MEWISRLSRVLRSQINSWQQAHADPEQLLEQALAEMEQQVVELRRGLAGAIAACKSTERSLAGYRTQAQVWYERAQLALDKQQESLAREALTHRQSYLSQAENLSQQLSEQQTVIRQLQQDLRTLERKLQEAKGKKSLYVARLRSALASQKMQEILGNTENGIYTNIFEKIELQILQLESESQLAGDPLEQDFAALERQSQVESELKSLQVRQRENRKLGQASATPQDLEQEMQQLRSQLTQASSPNPPSSPSESAALPDSEWQRLKSQLDQI